LSFFEYFAVKFTRTRHGVDEGSSLFPKEKTKPVHNENPDNSLQVQIIKKKKKKGEASKWNRQIELILPFFYLSGINFNFIGIYFTVSY
jgi:hypothetical protein